MDARQLSIFDIEPEPAFPATEDAYRHTDPDTSRRAAQDAGLSASRGRLIALETLAVHGALTDFELAQFSHWQQTSIGKRRGECVAAGLVENTGYKRPAPSGSAAIVWRITSAGRDYLKEYHVGTSD